MTINWTKTSFDTYILVDVGIDIDIGNAPDDSLQQNEERGDREVRDEHEHRVDDEGYRQKDLKI